ncbi:MAG: anthranilate synthase component I, partial [Dehalococcoidales bacterium]
MYRPTLEEVKKMAGQGNLVPVYREIVADLETPVSAFLKINRGEPSFLLESVEGGQRMARYSFIGTEPYRLSATTAADNTDPLPAIAAEMDQFKMVPVAGLPRFCGGAVGYLSYDAVRFFERLPDDNPDSLDLPDLYFMITDTILIFDH